MIPKLRVYISASFEQKEEMRDVARALEALGMEVTSTWVYQGHDATTTLPGPQQEAITKVDLREVKHADVMLHIADGRRTGTNVSRVVWPRWRQCSVSTSLTVS